MQSRISRSRRLRGLLRKVDCNWKSEWNRTRLTESVSFASFLTEFCKPVIYLLIILVPLNGIEKRIRRRRHALMVMCSEESSDKANRLNSHNHKGTSKRA